VKVGEEVAWELFFDSQQSNFRAPLIWTIYFLDKHPFGSPPGREWSQRTEPDQKVFLDIGTAREPGDYKYGVRIINAETCKEISDDDPRLIVRP
jgi:hypothetical protein